MQINQSFFDLRLKINSEVAEIFLDTKDLKDWKISGEKNLKKKKES